MRCRLLASWLQPLLFILLTPTGAMAKATQSRRKTRPPPKARMSPAMSPQSRVEEAAVRSSREGSRLGWKECREFLRSKRGDGKQPRPNQLQLMNIISCNRLMWGIEASVNWYTGGHTYAKLTTAGAETTTGIFVGRVKWVDPRPAPCELRDLRRLGSMQDLLEFTRQDRKALGKKKVGLLMEMFQGPVSSDAATCGSSELDDRADPPSPEDAVAVAHRVLTTGLVRTRSWHHPCSRGHP